MNYFELFGIPEAPVVERTLLSQKYFSLQRENHPDFFGQANEDEKATALERSADINKAFTIFQDKEKTLEYFLRLKQVIHTDEKYDLPQDFLMEMMEMNESIGEEDTGIITGRLKQYENDLFAEIAPLLTNYKIGQPNGELFAALKLYYYKKKYVQRILDRLAD